ncbi:DsbA family oxidoreductase [Synechocystis sp. PCC 7509]|uniref:DsbA family oxidoreductase n=1 Tax=Synechocystis sp. PCC 7509 TaxID=927677 RepID=UPI0002ABA638|nr:DsbA family oxidoreductase [Synechocystis sp. PCC 7509]
MTLTIEITSDFICPWCLVVDKRLNRAIEQLKAPIKIKRLWYPFELNPTMPEAGMNRKTYRSHKFGSWEYSQSLDAQTMQAASGDGIKFRYDLMQVTPNTLKAHRLSWLAEQEGKATEMVERILNAYFTEGQDITDVETLAKLAEEVGLKGDIRAFLNSTEGVEEVKALEEQAASRNIRGVPSIKIGRETIVGAQSVEVFLAALQTAVNELEVV